MTGQQEGRDKLKANKEMVLREIAGEHILVPTGSAAMTFQGMITLNDAGLLIWQKMQEECTEEELVEAVMQEYEVEEEVAKADVKAFLTKMKDVDVLLENC